MSDENKKTRSRKSSEYLRVVGETRINVFNSKQEENLPKKAQSKKWAVVLTTGKKKAVHSVHDKKADAIKSLLAKEIQLKAAVKEDA